MKPKTVFLDVVTRKGFANGEGSLALVIATLLCLPSFCLAVPPVSFSSGTNYSTTSSDLTCVTVADFNHDGKLDLAAGGIGCGVSILLGAGTGSFGPATVYNYDPLNGPAAGMAVGDFNSDSNLDLVIIQAGDTNNVMVLSGNGNGGFAFLTNYTVPYCSKLAAGDFNGDGKTDLALGRTFSNSITVLLGNSNGGFTIANSYAPGKVDYLAVADVNGDTNLDLVVVRSETNAMVTLLGNGNGSFGTIRTNIGPNATVGGLVVGDISNDAKPDVIATYKDDFIRFWFGAGNGSFLGPTNLAVSFDATAAAIGDINGDGNSDLIVLNNRYPSTPSYVVMLLGDGFAHFTNGGSYAVGNRPLAIAVADFDGDGRLDVVTANYLSPGSLSVLLNRSAPALSVQQLNASTVGLSWPNWAGYQLEWTTNTGLANSWVLVTNPPLVVGNWQTVADSITNGSKFFRLKR